MSLSGDKILSHGAHHHMKRLAIAVTLPFLFGASDAARQQPPDVRPNPNVTSAGSPSGDTLVVQLETQVASWTPDLGSARAMRVPAFAARGAPTQNPGPFIRAAAGTTLRFVL